MRAEAQNEFTEAETLATQHRGNNTQIKILTTRKDGTQLTGEIVSLRKEKRYTFPVKEGEEENIGVDVGIVFGLVAVR